MNRAKSGHSSTVVNCDSGDGLSHLTKSKSKVFFWATYSPGEYNNIKAISTPASSTIQTSLRTPETVSNALLFDVASGQNR